MSSIQKVFTALALSIPIAGIGCSESLPKHLVPYDENKNGKIDLVEALKYYEGRNREWKMVDEDRDGKISHAEMQTVIDLFSKASFQEGGSDAMREAYWEIAAMLRGSMNGKNFIPNPLLPKEEK